MEELEALKKALAGMYAEAMAATYRAESMVDEELAMQVCRDVVEFEDRMRDWSRDIFRDA